MKKIFFLLNILILTNISQAISLPFSSDFGNKYSITEGYYYSQAEQKIHGNVFHGGVDYALPYGSPVYAPTDGYIVGSYHDEMLDKYFENQKIHYGRGRHVVIFSPQDEKIVLLGHLSSIESTIPIDFPVAKLSKNMKPIKYISNIANMSKQGLLEKFSLKKVQKGDIIGTVGTSGLGLGTGFDNPYDVPYFPALRKHSSWDEPHIHMEVYYKKNIFSKKNKIDPYGLYKDAGFYQRYFGENDGTIFDFSGGSIEFAKYIPFSGEANKKLLLEKLKSRKSN